MAVQSPASHWFFYSDVEMDSLLQHPDPRGAGFGTNSLVDRLMLPLMKHLAKSVPGTVAPNVLTLAGLVCLMHGAYLAEERWESMPFATAVLCGLLATAYYVFDAIDGIHAANIRNTSNIGSLLVTSVNSVAPALLALMLCRVVLAVRDPVSIWYAVQASQLFFVFLHLCDLLGVNTRMVKVLVGGPASVVLLFPLLCAARAAFALVSAGALPGAFDLWQAYVTRVVGYIELLPGCADVRAVVAEAADHEFTRDAFVTLYAMVVVSIVVGCLLPPSAAKVKTQKDLAAQTQTRVLICVFYRIVPGLVMGFFGASGSEVSVTNILIDGLFLSVVSTDVVVSRMAGRALHPWLIIFSMVSVLDHFVQVLMCMAYFISVFYDLSAHSQTPIFSVQCNVYVDGVYDLCHIGHMRMFEASAKFGNRLFVGVINDEDATPYKRKPVMTHEERCVEVGACKYVSKVIPNAPCYGIPRDFIEKHNIHLVVCGEEYFSNPKDKYYCVPREMGILRAAPRTQGMSTSDLIKRILSVEADSLQAKDKLRGESLVQE